MTHFFKIVQTPVGALKLVATDKGLSAILWENDDPTRVPLGPLIQSDEHVVLKQVERQLHEYFAGERRVFDIELDPLGTDFQKNVWNALLAIPYGETRSYAQIATAVGNPKASRAVGAANGKNPISNVTPCHASSAPMAP